MSKKTAEELNHEKKIEVFSAMAAEGHIPEGNVVSRLGRAYRADPVLLPIVKNKEGPKGRTSLMFAAKEADLARVRFLLEKGADPTKEDVDFHTVVYYAAVGGNRQILDLLLEYGADLNYQNRLGNTALHYAAAYGNIAAVEILCAAGIDVNKLNGNRKTALMECLEPTMMRVKNRPSDETKTEIVRILQDRTDLTVQSKQGSTALAIACSNANVESVRLLCRNSEVNIADNDGSTPLLILLTHIRFSFTPEKHIGNIEEIVEILLTNGADTTVQDNRLDFYINRLIQDEELKTRLLEKVALARSGARGGATRKRKSKKSRRRKTRKARS